MSLTQAKHRVAFWIMHVLNSHRSSSTRAAAAPAAPPSTTRSMKKTELMQAELQPVVARLTERLQQYSQDADRAEQLQAALDKQEFENA